MSKGSPQSQSKYNGINTAENSRTVEFKSSNRQTLPQFSSCSFASHNIQSFHMSAARSKTSPGGMSVINNADKDSIPTYTVSVIGYPKSGKSCFCNRLVCPHPDWYEFKHTSVLSTSDFSGPVVNSEHWLYWGTATRRIDDDTNIRFRVVEQTEFTDDSTFRPFSSTTKALVYQYGKELNSPYFLHDYLQRSVTVKLFSPKKLRYHCTEQLGQEQLYHKEYFPDKELEVHGFFLLYDVSERSNSDLYDYPSNQVMLEQQQQFKYLSDILTFLNKRKKPVVVVASKRDIVDEQSLSNVLQFIQKSNEFRKVSFVEVSSHRNINIDQAFSAMVRLLDNRPRFSKIRPLSYQVAVREQDEQLCALREAFVKRLSTSPPEFLVNWKTFMLRFSHQVDIARFIEVWGTAQAQETFKWYTQIQKIETKRRHMAALPKALDSILLSVGPVTGKSFESLKALVREHDLFETFFIDVAPSPDRSYPCMHQPKDNSLSDTNSSANQHGVVCSGVSRRESRIPFSLALKESPGGDCPLLESINSLTASEAWISRMSAYEAALFEWQDAATTWNESGELEASEEEGLLNLVHAAILPGQPFEKFRDEFDGFYEDVSDGMTLDDQTLVYQIFQECLRRNAREEFLDLLLEYFSLFIRGVTAYYNCLEDNFSNKQYIDYISPRTNITLTASEARLCASLAPPRGAKEQHLAMISQAIAKNPRYKVLIYMPSERQTYLASHFDILLRQDNFEQTPSPRQIPFAQTSAPGRHFSYSEKPAPIISPVSRSISTAANLDCRSELSFPSISSDCPAYASRQCIDTIFANLCQVHNLKILDQHLGWNGRDDGTGFFNQFSCLRHGDERLSVAVCCICTDVTAAAAAVNLFHCVGFVSEKPISSNISFEAVMQTRFVHQNLISSWPLSTTLLTERNLCGTSLSPVTGVVKATFLSHHELIATIMSQRSRHPSSPVFDGVVFITSSSTFTPSEVYPSCCKCCLNARSHKPQSVCMCCRCSLGRLSHNYHNAGRDVNTINLPTPAPRQRSLTARVTAIKSMIEYISPLPYLILLSSQSSPPSTPQTDVLEKQVCNGKQETEFKDFKHQSPRHGFFICPDSPTVTNVGSCSPQTPIAITPRSASQCHARSTSSSAFTFEGIDEDEDNSEEDEDDPTSRVSAASKPGAGIVLDALSGFLSKCWTQRRMLRISKERPGFIFPLIPEKTLSRDSVGSSSTLTRLRHQQKENWKPKSEESKQPFRSSPKSIVTRRCRHNCRNRHNRHHHRQHRCHVQTSHHISASSSGRISQRSSLNRTSLSLKISPSASLTTTNNAILAIPPPSLEKFRLPLKTEGDSNRKAEFSGSRRLELGKLRPPDDLAPIPRFRSRSMEIITDRQNSEKASSCGISSSIPVDIPIEPKYDLKLHRMAKTPQPPPLVSSHSARLDNLYSRSCPSSSLFHQQQCTDSFMEIKPAENSDYDECKSSSCATYRLLQVPSPSFISSKMITIGDLHRNSTQRRRRQKSNSGKYTWVEDALPTGNIQLIPCEHLTPETHLTPPFIRSLPERIRAESAGQKSAGGIAICQPQQLHKDHFQVPSPPITSVAVVGNNSLGSMVSGLLAASGLGRPRERRRSVSTPGGEFSTGTSSSMFPLTPTFGVSMAGTPRQINSDKSQSTPQTAASSTELSSKDECLGPLSTGTLFHLTVSSLTELLLLATPRQIPGKRGYHLHHWHNPNCSHRLCIPCHYATPPRLRGANRSDQFVSHRSFDESLVMSSITTSDNGVGNGSFNFRSISDHLPNRYRCQALGLETQQQARFSHNPRLSMVNFSDLTPSDDFELSQSAVSAAQAYRLLHNSPAVASATSTSGSGRRSKRTLKLSLFSGRHTTSEPHEHHPHYQSQQEVRMASFPSTPIRESGVTGLHSFSPSMLLNNFFQSAPMPSNSLSAYLSPFPVPFNKNLHSPSSSTANNGLEPFPTTTISSVDTDPQVTDSTS